MLIRIAISTTCLDDYGGDLEALLAHTREAGVNEILSISVEKANIPVVAEIAASNPSVFGSVGIHPLHVSENEVSRAELQQWCRMPGIVAVGETGLDYHYDVDSREAQKQSFALHLEVAAAEGLPVIVHTRDARTDTLDLIREHCSREHAGVLHCFTEDLAMAEAALALGFYISISGIVSFANARELREVVANLPAERLLIETDAPWLAPVPHRGKSNQPRYVIDVARAVAEVRQISIEEVAQTTRENFLRLFPRADVG